MVAVVLPGFDPDEVAVRRGAWPLSGVTKPLPLRRSRAETEQSMAVERSQEAGRHTERRDDVLVPVAHGVEHRAPRAGR